MSMTGSGVGGQVGGPQQPSTTELETQAATTVSKQALGLVKDSLEIPFSQMAKPWKYKASGDSPELSKPLFSSRVSNQPPPEDDTSWKGMYEQLVNSLPKQVRTDLQSEMKKPFATRDPDYNVLDNVISFAAKALGWLAGTSALRDTQRTEDRNNMVTNALYSGVIAQCGESLSGLQSSLNELGANYPHFDTATKFSSELQEHLDTFQSIPASNKQGLNDVAGQVSNLSTQYERTVGNDDFMILGSTLKAMSTMTAALSMQNVAPASFVTFALANIGIKNSDSELGIVGNQLNSLIQNLSSGILSNLVTTPEEGAKQLLPQMLTMAIVGSIILSSIVNNQGIGNNPVNQDSDPKDNRSLTLDLILHMAFASNTITHIFQTSADGCGANEADADMLSKGLSIATLLLIASAAANNNESKLDSSLDSMNLFINQGVNDSSQYVNDGLLSGKLEGDTTSSMGVALQQAQISLQENNNPDFINSLTNLLNQSNIAPDSLFKELQDLQNVSNNIAYALTSGMDDKTNLNTSITTAA